MLREVEDELSRKLRNKPGTENPEEVIILKLNKILNVLLNASSFFAFKLLVF